MDIITYDEYKERYKKMTKIERAFYETYYKFHTKMLTEKALKEISDLKEEMRLIKESILKDIRNKKADKIGRSDV